MSDFLTMLDEIIELTYVPELPDNVITVPRYVQRVWETKQEKISDTTARRILNDLVQSGLLETKEYKKWEIYSGWISQNNSGVRYGRYAVDHLIRLNNSDICYRYQNNY